MNQYLKKIALKLSTNTKEKVQYMLILKHVAMLRNKNYGDINLMLIITKLLMKIVTIPLLIFYAKV